MEHSNSENTAGESTEAKAAARAAFCAAAHAQWFPIDQLGLRRIKSQFRANRYGLDANLIINDLLNDPALFLYCLRELYAKATRGEVVIASDSDPIGQLHSAGFFALREIVLAAHDSFSIHSLNDADIYRVTQRLELTSALTAASMLAAPLGLTPEYCKALILLVYLPAQLVAWNLPTIYRNAICSIPAGADLSSRIEALTGFSHAELFLALTEGWSLSPEIRETVTGLQSGVGVTEDTVARRCLDIARAFGCAQHPEYYPRAHADWIFAQKSIRELLGAEGFENLKSLAIREADAALIRFPRELAESARAHLERSLLTEPDAALFESNPFITRCSGTLRAALCDLYRRKAACEGSKPLIAELTSQVIPRAGFLRGCIYTFEPAQSRLVPRLAIGSADLDIVKPLDCSALSRDAHLALRALRSSRLLCEKLSWGDDVTLSIAQTYGKVQCAGVIHLDTGGAVDVSEEEPSIIRYKAIRQALIDILELK